MRAPRRLVPLLALVTAVTACSSTSAGTPHAAPVPSTSSATTSPAPKPSPPPTHRPTPKATKHAPARTHTSRPVRTPMPTPSTRLPLALPTGSATRIVTVVAPSTSSTTGRLQAWQKSGGHWTRYGPEVTAWLGSDGVSTHPSESTSATPIGSFTLTEAFGRNPNPGTALPYRQTTPADWWISQSGPLYNTEQHCSGNCPFAQGDPNEHLYYVTPYYDYAVVIDYNRSPVVQGAGSAFFLHVAVGQPTAGCVAIPMPNLVTLMRWLTPSAHPRILIGTG